MVGEIKIKKETRSFAGRDASFLCTKAPHRPNPRGSPPWALGAAGHRVNTWPPITLLLSGPALSFAGLNAASSPSYLFSFLALLLRSSVIVCNHFLKLLTFN